VTAIEPDAVLRLSELAVEYRDRRGVYRRVVDDVSLGLVRGETLGVAGESGCGKSTVALTAIGYVPPGARVAHGRSELAGAGDLLTLEPKRLQRVWGARIGYVAQDSARALNPAIPVGRQLGQVLRTHLHLARADNHARQIALFHAVGLDEPERALRRYPHEFSGGQQQRIAIAIAVACEPDVLILDEPTTGLDVTTQRRIADLIRGLIRERNVAALYVSHDLALLGSVATRLAVMYAGQIAEYGRAADVLRRQSHPYTRALLAAAPSATDARVVVGIPGSPPDRVIHDSCAFAPRCVFAEERCRAGYVRLATIAGSHIARCVRLDDIPRLTARPPAAVEGRAPSGAAAVLEVENLRCRYQRSETEAVAGVSLAVHSAETVGVVGESGSGKSTLLRAISGLHRPTAGVIRLEGRVLEPTVKERARSSRGNIQLIFQNPDSSLNPRQSVRQILERPVRLFRDADDRAQTSRLVAEMLEAVKLTRATAERYPAELSGGQRQRVAIARAFAAKPVVLLCDEITSALDVSVQATVLELLSNLAKEFKTGVVFVSHDLGVVRTVASRAIVMRHGEVCEATDVEMLFTAPQHPYTYELLSSVRSIAPPVHQPIEGKT
jgi:peptide/nickel transport system ATP-binding protein